MAQTSRSYFPAVIFPMNDLRARYRCLNQCEGEYPLDEVIYRCPKCHDLLEVVHDIRPLAGKSGQEWRDTFDQRVRLRTGISASGVWAKQEWVHPHLDVENLVSLGEGYSHLFKAERLGEPLGLDHLHLKQCGNSHTGSFKDLGMTVLVSQVKHMIAQGCKIKAVICASTGDTSAALAAYCAAANIPAVVLLPADKISPAQLIQPIAHGALTLALETDFDGCMRIVQQLAEQEDFYLANSMNSLRLEGQKTVAFEIVQQLDWQAPDWVIVPGGNLGNVSAIGKGFLMMRALGVIDRLPRLVCAQAEHANPLYESFQNSFREFNSKQAKTTLASAIQIGNPVSFKKAIKVLQELDGVVEQASEHELANAAALADRCGLFACPQTGVALATLIKMAARREIKRSDTVVVVSTASGLKFADFKIAYHQETIKDIAFHYANHVQVLPAELRQVNDAIKVFVTDANM